MQVEKPLTRSATRAQNLVFNKQTMTYGPPPAPVIAYLRKKLKKNFGYIYPSDELYSSLSESYLIDTDGEESEEEEEEEEEEFEDAESHEEEEEEERADPQDKAEQASLPSTEDEDEEIQNPPTPPQEQPQGKPPPINNPFGDLFKGIPPERQREDPFRPAKSLARTPPKEPDPFSRSQKVARTPPTKRPATSSPDQPGSPSKTVKPKSAKKLRQLAEGLDEAFFGRRTRTQGPVPDQKLPDKPLEYSKPKKQ
jgi:hypothetical protein